MNTLVKPFQRMREIVRPRETTELLMTGRFDEAWYLFRNRARGLDLEFMSLRELGLSAERSVEYCNSGGPDLVRVLRSRKIPAESRALDLGCGKGGAAITLAGFPFDEVMGVDISADLVQVARANVARLRLPSVRFVCGDAAAFTDFDRFTHLYMYNPFPAAVVRPMLQNLVASLARRPREMVIIYRNPVCHEDILATGVFQQTAEFKLLPKYRSFIVYRHQAGARAPSAPASPRR